jgi:hypothetical protein
VWSDFAFVSHDGGGGTDSSGNATTTAQGGVTSGGVAGKIGNATDYDGGDDFFKLSGLTFATFLTLFVIPIVYSLVTDLRTIVVSKVKGISKEEASKLI